MANWGGEGGGWGGGGDKQQEVYIWSNEKERGNRKHFSMQHRQPLGVSYQREITNQPSATDA